MASPRNFICLVALISACCMVTEARRLGKSREARQTMFDIPFDQTESYAGGSAPVFSAGGSAGGGGFGAGGFGGAGASASVIGDSDSESSEESDVDMGVASIDTAGINEMDAADIPEITDGNSNNIGGYILPILRGDRGMTFEARKKKPMLRRTSGSSGRGVGIAFAVLGLLTIVVAAAAFVLRKYRHNIPVLVWV